MNLSTWVQFNPVLVNLWEGKLGDIGRMIAINTSAI
jgi:hypothetical protein